MSLINDALKRATTERPAPSFTSHGSDTPPLQPVETPPSPRTSPALVGGVLLLGIGAIGIAAALWFNGKAAVPVNAKVQAQPAEVHAPASANVAASGAQQISTAQNPVQRAAAQLQAVAARNEVPPANNPAPQPTANTPAPTTPTQTAKAPANAPKPAAVTVASAPATSGTAPKPAHSRTTESAADKPVRLQSIFYRLKSPTVIINGKTLGIGDSADGVQVVSIQRTSVEIVQGGKYRTLTLQD